MKAGLVAGSAWFQYVLDVHSAAHGNLRLASVERTEVPHLVPDVY